MASEQFGLFGYPSPSPCVSIYAGKSKELHSFQETKLGWGSAGHPSPISNFSRLFTEFHPRLHCFTSAHGPEEDSNATISLTTMIFPT
jgi:hypothetical protein